MGGGVEGDEVCLRMEEGCVCAVVGGCVMGPGRGVWQKKFRFSTRYLAMKI